MVGSFSGSRRDIDMYELGVLAITLGFTGLFMYSQIYLIEREHARKRLAIANAAREYETETQRMIDSGELVVLEDE